MRNYQNGWRDFSVSSGHDAIHTLDLPSTNRTSDAEISRLADDQSRIVVTQDHDFLDSHTLFGRPSQLLLLFTGNISNNELTALFSASIGRLEYAFELGCLVELSRTAIVVHDQGERPKDLT